MPETYQYSFFSIPFQYEIRPGALVIRARGKEQSVPWSTMTKAAYLAPAKKPSFWTLVGRPAQMLRALSFVFTLHAVKDQGTLLILSDSSRLDKVFLDEADPQAKAFLVALRGRLQTVWQGEASTIRAAYRLLGIPPELERLFWLPRLILILFLLSLVLTALAGVSPVFLAIGVLGWIATAFAAIRLSLDVFVWKKMKKEALEKSSTRP